MSCLFPLVLSTMTGMVAILLVGVWASSSLSLNGAFTHTSCVVAGYSVNDTPSSCIELCCARDANGYCSTDCLRNCWYGNVWVNVTGAPLSHLVLWSTGALSLVSPSAMLSTLQGAWPVGRALSCYYEKADATQLVFSDGYQGFFIASMVLFGVCGLSLVATVILCALQ